MTMASAAAITQKPSMHMGLSVHADESMHAYASLRCSIEQLLASTAARIDESAIDRRSTTAILVRFVVVRRVRALRIACTRLRTEVDLAVEVVVDSVRTL